MLTTPASMSFMARLQISQRKSTARVIFLLQACRAFDCRLWRGAFFPPLWAANSPRVSTLCLWASPPAAVTSEGPAKAVCWASPGPPGANQPRCPRASRVPGEPGAEQVLSPALPFTEGTMT